ncbi:AraC family transcriptional regulator, partial [Pseudoclavibacter helvolus]
MRIGLIAIDGCFGSAIASIIDIVRVADGARGDVDPRIDPIELAILGPKRRVTTTASMTLSVDHPLSESGEFDVVVVPALGTLTAAATHDALQSRDARSVIASLGRLDEA